MDRVHTGLRNLQEHLLLTAENLETEEQLLMVKLKDLITTVIVMEENNQNGENLTLEDILYKMELTTDVSQ